MLAPLYGTLPLGMSVPVMKHRELVVNQSSCHLSLIEAEVFRHLLAVTAADTAALKALA